MKRYVNKRIFVFLLCGLLAFSCFGCGRGGEAPADP